MKLQNIFAARYSPWSERLFLCLAVLLAYASVWRNEFVFDDIAFIARNASLRHWGGIFDFLTSRHFASGERAGIFYRPVPVLLYFFVYQIFGLSTVAFHALNIIVQALNACLLHHFGIRIGFKKGAAFAAALLWAVHPLHTEAVTYMSATSELLWSSFCLAGLIALLPDFAPRRIGLAMVFFMLALGSKGSAVIFPALAVITFFLVSKERAHITAYLRTWPLWLLAAGYTAAMMWFIHTSGYTLDKTGDPRWDQFYTSNLINRILTCLATLPVYARLTVWPAGLHIERIFPTFLTLFLWQPMTGALMAGLGLLQIFFGRARALSFAFLWFAVALFPATGIAFPINGLIAERWMYMPTMGLFLGVAQTAAGFFEKKQNAAQALVLALALSLGVATFLQNETWRNTETLYQNILQNGGYTPRIGSHLGMFYMEQGEFDKAIAQFQDEIAHPDQRTKVQWAETHLQLAMAWLHIPPDKGGETFTLDIHALPSDAHVPEAIAELGKATVYNPDFIWAHAALAALYRYQGNTQMADFHEKKVRDILQNHQ